MSRKKGIEMPAERRRVMERARRLGVLVAVDIVAPGRCERCNVPNQESRARPARRMTKRRRPRRLLKPKRKDSEKAGVTGTKKGRTKMAAGEASRRSGSQRGWSWRG